MADDTRLDDALQAASIYTARPASRWEIPQAASHAICHLSMSCNAWHPVQRAHNTAAQHGRLAAQAVA